MTTKELLEILNGNSKNEPEIMTQVRRMLEDCYPYYYRDPGLDIPAEYGGGIMKRLETIYRNEHQTFDENVVSKALLA